MAQKKGYKHSDETKKKIGYNLSIGFQLDFFRKTTYNLSIYIRTITTNITNGWFI